MDLVFTKNRSVYIPEREITEDKPEYVYVPLRGYSSILAVFSSKDKAVGHILTKTLGYKDVDTWMRKTKYVDQGY